MQCAACPPALPVAPLLTDFSPCCPAADSPRCRVGQDTFIKVIIGCTVAAAAWAVGSDALGLDAGTFGLGVGVGVGVG